MKAAVIIPARYQSQRFPGKPLVSIAGKPLIQHIWEKAVQTNFPVTIATDDDRIADAAIGFGAHVVMTGLDCNNGTERCCEAAEKMDADIIINWQGDCPLAPPDIAIMLAQSLELNPSASVATPVMKIRPHETELIRADRAREIMGAVTVAMSDKNCLYFSRELIPSRGPHFLHVGMYAIRRSAMKDYGICEFPLEKSEGLEQLRWLELGHEIAAVRIQPQSIWEVNNPGDVQIVEEILNETSGK